MSAEDKIDREKPAEEPVEQPAPRRKPRVRKRADAKQQSAKGGTGDAAEGAQPPAEQKPRGARSRGARAAPKAPEREPAEAARPAPRTRRGGAPRRRAVRARARYVRTSARKARLVSGHLRGKSVQDARAILAFTPREVARDWSKLLESAVANAESNHELLEADLIVRDAYADEGPTIKRFRPRAMGRATAIRKRTSHLTITLTPKP